MWKVVYIAQTKENAQEIKELLTNNGFLIQMNVAGAKKGGQGNQRPLLRSRRCL